MSRENQNDTMQQETRISYEVQENHIPVIAAPETAVETEMRAYRKKLRQYFISGEKTEESVDVTVAPVLLAGYLRGVYPDMPYPVLYDVGNKTTTPVRQVLRQVFNDTFGTDEGDILSKYLLRLELSLRESLAENGDTSFSTLINSAIKTLQELDVHGKEGEVFLEDCKRFEAALQKREGTLVPFSSHAALHLLNLQLNTRRENTRIFSNTLKKQISSLQEILMAYGEGQERGERSGEHSEFDFADKMISFDKLAEMMPHVHESPASLARMQRVHQCLRTLEKAQTWLTTKSSFVFVSKQLANVYSVKEILSEASIVYSDEDACVQASAFFQDEIVEYVRIVAAIRMADLEIRQEYDEDLHNPYFEGFGILHLSDEDMQHLPALIVIEDCRQLLRAPENFLSLITGNVPVKVLAINRLEALEQPHQGAVKEVFRQELSALALSHRNAYIFQGAADTPDLLYQALHDGLHTSSPVLWNILFTDPGSDQPTTDYLSLHTAIESRYFPRLVYNIEAGERFGNRFDISGNPQPELAFPSWSLETETPEGNQTRAFSLTVADYFALNPRNISSLEVIPSMYENADLLPVEEYLQTSQGNLIGKIPVIGVVDEQNIFRQAAIPLSWLRHCSERLSFWQFIQELGGINSYHVQRAMEESRAALEAEKETEIAQLRSEMEAEIERVRQEEVSNAMERLVNSLLDIDNLATSLSDQPPVSEKAAQSTAVPAAQKVVKPITKEEAEKKHEVSADVWIETFLCTSCNDCIDALPAVFKYNDEKQAIVHNPKGGTYAKIVKTAEKCPAKCIHPGLPQNPDEAGLDKLLKRAEKYN